MLFIKPLRKQLADHYPTTGLGDPLKLHCIIFMAPTRMVWFSSSFASTQIMTADIDISTGQSKFDWTYILQDDLLHRHP